MDWAQPRLNLLRYLFESERESRIQVVLRVSAERNVGGGVDY